MKLKILSQPCTTVGSIILSNKKTNLTTVEEENYNKNDIIVSLPSSS
jgi:hypothetical protein